MKKLLLIALLCAGQGVVSAQSAGWIEAYPGSGSVRVGEALGFHISSTVGEVKIEATRIEYSYNSRTLIAALPVTEQAVTSEQPWRTGPQWAVSYRFTIPEDWQPGMYDFRVREAANIKNYVRFLVAVQPAENGSFSHVAVLSNDSTSNAYTTWGGKSNYRSLIPGELRANVLALSRPKVYEYKWVDWAFPKWTDMIGMPVEYVTSLQLHYEPGLLDAYDVLVLSGHSEYWSREMRAELERFLEQGGKLVSLSGNTMWWSVRFRETTHGIQMISCKGWKNDPECPDNDPDLYTGYWHLMGNPETRVLGASFKFGGYVDSHGYYPASLGYGGYFAENSDHWLWAGTGVLSGDHVGDEAGIAGYEADGVPMIFSARGLPLVDPAATDLPQGITILGTTPAATPNWEGNGTIIHFAYGDNGGEVFNCASVDCAEGLVTDVRWRKAMLNVFERFGALEAVRTDYDFDGIDDLNDNCIDASNPDQLDSFSDGTGDACDQHCH